MSKAPEDQKRDEILKRMLSTPPKPHAVKAKPKAKKKAKAITKKPAK
jgi:hypothetical protein